jgi:NAD(P)-dependent dehydrogenase (short-subunit alcohol dehydrogenase family)
MPTDDEGSQPRLRVVKSPSRSGNGGSQLLPRIGPPAPKFAPGTFGNLFDLRNQTALVVGGGGGIGSAIGSALADFGARVAIADLDIEAAKRAAAGCARPNVEGSLAVAIDVANPASVASVVSALEKQLGKIDILVNSAGINIRKPATDYTPDEWRRIIDINLSGVFYVTQAVAKGMLQRKYGRIVSLGSVSSLLGHPYHAPYAASKGGIAIMTKALATEWAPLGVTVNAIGPAYTETPLISELTADRVAQEQIIATIPMGRLGKVDDIVGAAVFLCSESSRFITGQTLYIDGGRTAD